MTDRVTGFDDGYRKMMVRYPTSQSKEYLVGYVEGVNSRIVDERKAHADQTGN